MAGGLVQPTSSSFIPRLSITDQLRASPLPTPRSNQEPSTSAACGVRLPCGVRSRKGDKLKTKITQQLRRKTVHGNGAGPLNLWNDRIVPVKLRAVGTKNNDLMLEMTFNDHVKVDQLFNHGLALSKLCIVVLNIGTAGFFWYEFSGQTEAYYEYRSGFGSAKYQHCHGPPQRTTVRVVRKPARRKKAPSRGSG